MLYLDSIPNVNSIDSTSENANGTMIAQLIIFYIGVFFIILVCIIPPFTVFLPVVVPVMIVIVLGISLLYFGKFIESAGYTFNSISTNIESAGYTLNSISTNTNNNTT